MNTSSIYAMVQAVMATLGGTDTPEDIMNALAYWMTVFDPSSTEGWRAVFEFLGIKHPDELRFQILEAAITMLQHNPNASNWLQVWMITIDAARIHPISLPLCSFRTWPSTKTCLLVGYAKFASCWSRCDST